MLSSNIFMFSYVIEKKGVKFAFCSLQVAAFAPARKHPGLPMRAPASLYEKSQELPEAVCFAWAEPIRVMWKETQGPSASLLREEVSG